MASHSAYLAFLLEDDPADARTYKCIILELIFFINSSPIVNHMVTRDPHDLRFLLNGSSIVYGFS